MSIAWLRHWAAAWLVFEALAPAARGQITNLLSNGTFESGNLNGWTANGATASTNRAHAGGWSARCTTQSMRTSVATIPGKAYKLTAWVKLDSESGNTSGWGGARLEAYDTSGTSWQTLAHSGWLVTVSRGTNWFKVALSFTATAGSTPIDVGYFGDAGRVVVAYFDDLRFFARPVTNTPPQLSAALTPTALGSLPQGQTFSLSCDDPDGAVKLVSWNFGDGSHAQTPAGSRTVAVPGDYLAMASVVDDDGAVSTQTIAWSAQDSTAPGLVVMVPAADGLAVSNSLLSLSGTASGSGIVVTASSEPGETGQLTGNTNWSGNILLHPGWNRVIVQVRDAVGRVAAVERRVRWAPAGRLAITDCTDLTNNVERWDIFEARFKLTNSAATHLQFPFETNPPPGLDWVDGVSVTGCFTPDQWRTVYQRPAFLQQPYQRALKDNQEWLYPGTNVPVWTVRFAPPLPGTWSYRLEAEEAGGRVQSAERSFTVRPASTALNHGPVHVAEADPRYFEHEDGTLFLGTGHGIGAGAERYSYDLEDAFAAQGDANEQFFRFWIAGHIWGSAWQPWSSRTLGYNGTVPNTGLSLAGAYGDGLVAWQVDNDNPVLWQGWGSGHVAIISGRAYRVRVRWRTEGITGPQTAGQPYGVCLRWVGWPEPGQTQNSPLGLTHEHGNTPWHVAEAVFTANGALLQSGNFLANPAVVFENCTGGRAYVDEISVRESFTGGAVGGELLRSPKANSHLTFDQRRGAGLDAICRAANQHGKYLKLVISEKQEQLLNWLGPGGFPDPLSGHFFAAAGSAGHRLQEYYWRHLVARLGAFRSVHSWETVNEEDPNSSSDFQLTADLAHAAHADGNPKLASTSTWATLALSTWAQPNLAEIDYVDFHCYVRGTGWIEPKDALANDSARFFREYDLAALAGVPGKPVIWGEQGIDGVNGTDGEEPALTNDVAGVWLHKLTWARTGPGGVYPLYWYTDNIDQKNLHGRFGSWNRFMASVPLNNGRYVDAAASVSDPALRVLGQKDLLAGRAHLWLDNSAHTWRAVVGASNVPSLTASAQVAMNVPGQHYLAIWFNPTNGLAFATNSVIADNAGVVTLLLQNLATDLSVQLQPAEARAPLVQFRQIRRLTGGVYLEWEAEPGYNCQLQYQDNLNALTWSNLGGTISSAGLRLDQFDPTPANAARFYRVKLVP